MLTRRLLAVAFLIVSSLTGFSQAYIPMPADTAVWRYRIFDIDDFTQVLDNMLFQNGKDTTANGNTYHKIMSRTYHQVEMGGVEPPIVTVVANAPDYYYAAIRETGKKVFLLSASGEQLIYDFNVNVGDSVPAYIGKKKVVAIDSIAINSVYHKRYLTTDPNYSVIEGVGTTEGILPYINDGSGTVVFLCFTHHDDTWAVNDTVPCTYVYPYGYVSAVPSIDQSAEIEIYPVPAKDVLHMAAHCRSVVTIINSIGQAVWSGSLAEHIELPVAHWPRGVYYARAIVSGCNQPIVRKIIIY